MLPFRLVLLSGCWSEGSWGFLLPSLGFLLVLRVMFCSSLGFLLPPDAVPPDEVPPDAVSLHGVSLHAVPPDEVSPHGVPPHPPLFHEV